MFGRLFERLQTLVAEQRDRFAILRSSIIFHRHHPPRARLTHATSADSAWLQIASNSVYSCLHSLMQYQHSTMHSARNDGRNRFAEYGFEIDCIFYKRFHLAAVNPLKGRGVSWLHFAVQV